PWRARLGLACNPAAVSAHRRAPIRVRLSAAVARRRPRFVARVRAPRRHRRLGRVGRGLWDGKGAPASPDLSRVPRLRYRPCRAARCRETIWRPARRAVRVSHLRAGGLRAVRADARGADWALAPPPRRGSGASAVHAEALVRVPPGRDARPRLRPRSAPAKPPGEPRSRPLLPQRARVSEARGTGGPHHRLARPRPMPPEARPRQLLRDAARAVTRQ